MADNYLYYGDNLDILRQYLADESVDLIYLDPPFKSNQDYNILFAERNGSRSSSQVMAFGDTWYWDTQAALSFQEVVEGGGKVAQAMMAFRTYLGQNDMLAYLSMMAPRLVELRRVLKPTGSIFLHCDTTASHYLKILMDSVFGPIFFLNEIVWKRAQPKAHTKIRFSRAHDIILFYSKSADAFFNHQYRIHDEDYLKKFYRHFEPETGRRYRLDNLANPNKKRPNLTYEFPPGSGIVRVWRWTKERMMKAYEDGRVVITKDGGVAQYKRYLDEMKGTPITDVWDDIEHLHGSHGENLGYPTQKPEKLLERIISSGSRENDIVLDPFCGCGTTINVSQRLNRKWIGIDITPLAITLIKHRLRDSFGDNVSYEIIGEPVSLPDAMTLAQDDHFHFQYWVLGLVGARPVEERKGADKGIDGRIYFHDDRSGKSKQVIISVKGGHITVSHLRDLRGVIDRENAEIGVLLTLKEPTKPMREEAASSGFYNSGWNTKHQRLQILTVRELLEGRRIDYPPSKQTNRTFKKAPRAKPRGPENGELF